MNRLTQTAYSCKDKLVTIKNNIKPRTDTTIIEKEQTIIFTNNNKTSTG